MCRYQWVYPGGSPIRNGLCQRFQVVLAEFLDEIAAQDALPLGLHRDVNDAGEDGNDFPTAGGVQFGAEQGTRPDVMIDGQGQAAGEMFSTFASRRRPSPSATT